MTALSENSPACLRAKTLRALEALLAPLDDGPELFQTMIQQAPDAWGTFTGKHFHLGVTEDDGSYRSVLSWEVTEDGSVGRVKAGRLRTP